MNEYEEIQDPVHIYWKCTARLRINIMAKYGFLNPNNLYMNPDSTPLQLCELEQVPSWVLQVLKAINV